MSQSAPSRPLTVEEYLRREEGASVRHEYVAGQVYAMSGATRRHNRIVWNVLSRLKTAAEGGPCEVYFEAVLLRVDDETYYYPDVMALCTPQHDERIAEGPCLVVEVTSPSTASVDRREKLVSYQRIPTLQTYLVVDQRRRRVDRHWRDAAGEWWQVTIIGEGTIPVPCPATSLTLDEIYDGVQTVVGEPEPDEYEYADGDA